MHIVRCADKDKSHSLMIHSKGLYQYLSKFTTQPAVKGLKFGTSWSNLIRYLVAPTHAKQSTLRPKRKQDSELKKLNTRLIVDWYTPWHTSGVWRGRLKKRAHLHDQGGVPDVHGELVCVPAQVRRARVGVNWAQHAKPVHHQAATTRKIRNNVTVQTSAELRY